MFAACLANGWRDRAGSYPDGGWELAFNPLELKGTVKLLGGQHVVACAILNRKCSHAFMAQSAVRGQLTSVIDKYILNGVLLSLSEEIDAMRKSTLLPFLSLVFLLSSPVASEADSIIAQMNTPYSYQSGVPPYGTVRVAPSRGWWYDDQYHRFSNGQPRDDQSDDDQSDDDQAEGDQDNK
jgi:hypothetical protein